ncbi:MAG: TonB-dependent receptor [Thermodesulfobacteriota bacterium]
MTKAIPKIPLLAILMILLFRPPLFAQSAEKKNEEARPRFELPEMVVTAQREKTEVKEQPRSVTVITQEDIAASPAENVADLMGREAGVTVRSVTGTEKGAGIDLRGMGDTYGSNVAVLVDGFRLNPSDMSGPDLSSVALSDIERIEILRGGASVLYGDGAVGGVVNIITRTGDKKPSAKLNASYGSFGETSLSASSSGAVRGLTYAAGASGYDTDGYRQNSALVKRDGSLRLGYTLFEHLSVSAFGAAHNDQYGLPGPVPLAYETDPDLRRLSRWPRDNGASQDQRGGLSAEYDAGKYGRLSLVRGYRNRTNQYILGYSPLLPVSAQTDFINEDTRTLSCVYRLDYRLFSLDHRLVCGADSYDAGYVRTEISKAERTNLKLSSLGFFAENRFGLPGAFKFTLGGRTHRTRVLFREDQNRAAASAPAWLNGPVTDATWDNTAFEAGLTWEKITGLTLFGGYSESFRTPNADELAFSSQKLKPQTGEHWEAGGRVQAWTAAEISATAFLTRIQDELYYGEDPVTGIPENRNFENTTRRTGVEVVAKYYPVDPLFLHASYTYIRAEFEGSGALVPLVPQHKADLGAEWQVLEPLTLSADLQYVGSRPDGNDFEGNNRYPELPSYATLDLKATYAWKELRFFTGLNNLTDEQYSIVAYSESFYPMPGRTYYCGMTAEF